MKTNQITLLVVTASMASLVTMSGFRKLDSDVPSVIRAQKFELVDSRGKVHASLKTEEGGETVFRILDSTGTIRVKLGGDTNGSGIVLLNSATEVGFHATAKEETRLTLTSRDGKTVSLLPK